MCKSLAEGGQRCAAHTRPAYENTATTDPKWDDAAAAYASTPEGVDRLREEAHTARYNRDYELEARLLRAVHQGEKIREANREAAAAIARADLTTQDPADIDGELARLHGESYAARDRRDSEYEHLARRVARDVLGRTGYRETAEHAEVQAVIEDIHATPEAERDHQARAILTIHDRVEHYNRVLDDLDRRMRPLNKEFDRRGGWNRAFLVVNNGTGHVHMSMYCSTCRPTTQYHWVTEMSDKTEDEIVEAAGERACTVCYPSAPVNVLNRPTSIYSPEEREQQRSREARAREAEQRQADRVAKALTPDGSEFRVECTRNGHTERERFKTERAATTWMVSNMADYRGWLSHRTMDASMAQAHERIIEAIAAKHDKPVDEVRADIERKVEAKVRRDATR